MTLPSPACIVSAPGDRKRLRPIVSACHPPCRERECPVKVLGFIFAMAFPLLMGVCAKCFCVHVLECVNVRKRSLERGPAAAEFCGNRDSGEEVE